MSFDLCAGTDSDDEAVSDEHRSIFYESDIGKRSATTEATASQS
jgi:hypothetical protein